LPKSRHRRSMVAAVEACLREQGRGKAPADSAERPSSASGSGEFPALPAPATKK
jgi:hypothetical protein